MNKRKDGTIIPHNWVIKVDLFNVHIVNQYRKSEYTGRDGGWDDDFDLPYYSYMEPNGGGCIKKPWDAVEISFEDFLDYIYTDYKDYEDYIDEDLSYLIELFKKLNIN